jgi:cobalamin transport system substrate-binding protein
MKKPGPISTFILVLIIAASCRNRNTGSGIQFTVNPYITCAERFSILRTDSCTILTIVDPWQGAEDIWHSYYLVERGKESSLQADPSHVIAVPVKKMICMSSTHLAMVSALGERRSVVGISGTSYIYDPELRAGAERGIISEIGYDAGINSEVILNINPDLIIMYGIGSESAGYISRIAELGIKVMYDADYLEPSPLGKTEWIKVFGALFCKESLADSIFESVSENYNDLKSFIRDRVDAKPSVLLGLPFRDTWYISPGNSYISTLISDAGGRYLWEDTRSSVSMPGSFEAVFLKSMKADYWLNVGNVSSRSELGSLEQRLEKLPCFITGNIYNNTKRMSAGGGNDYWESGAMNPHIILKDIASILHPGLFDNHDLVYYKKIE